MALTVKSLHVYPVKSLRGHNLSSAQLDDFGIALDRRFMLVNEEGGFITQRKYPQLSFLSCEVFDWGVRIQGASLGTADYHLPAESRSISATVWKDSVEALLMESDNEELLSSFLGIKVSLVYMPESTFRQVDREFFAASQRVGFADGFPILLASQTSLDDLNGRLDQPIGMERFRPNIVVGGSDPYAEDVWRRIQIGSVQFELVKPCSRCVMTTIDKSGNKGVEPLRTLADYRRNEYGVCFGQNVVQLSKGSINVGDEVVVLS